MDGCRAIKKILREPTEGERRIFIYVTLGLGLYTTRTVRLRATQFKLHRLRYVRDRLSLEALIFNPSLNEYDPKKKKEKA